jgi:hypothetical protein
MLEKRGHRMGSVPAMSFTRPGGIWKMSVPPAGSSTSARPKEARERLAVVTVADETEAAGRGDIARNSTHVAALAPKRQVQRQPCHLIHTNKLSKLLLVGPEQTNTACKPGSVRPMSSYSHRRTRDLY